jgi:hypothetical protein
VIPALDEALSLAERLRDELAALAAAAADDPSVAGRHHRAALVALSDDADDLTSRIDLTRSGNR